MNNGLLQPTLTWLHYTKMPGRALIYNELISDDQMRVHLERQETLLFEGLGREWQQIERQVERLGFGEQYVVSQRASSGGSTKVSAERVAAQV